MNNPNEEVSQGDGGASLPPSQPGLETLRSLSTNKVLKSGPLFLSSKGIGWTSWKKRWFILTQTSLVFFRSDPNAVPQKASEVNITLGGIDLNNTGSVVVKAEKKLLTVAFSDGRDGRAFTLKTETTEDLFEWKNALESALAQAPPVTAQNGVGNDRIDNIPSDQLKDREPIKSTVIGRPILLALEEVDGSPSFLEKALQFIEEHGVKVEGILRQAADVEQVERRVREYEQGKTEFSANEDAHVIGDCIKHVLRELPSPPVPASCCKALVEACRTERGGKVSAMRAAINDTFPEPNRRLLQRILLMMQAIASHKAENRMSSSAVAACMAPLLLRSLMAGECEIENDFDVGGDGSAQLLQAAAAANHAQAIVITLLEEYDSMFGEGSVTPDIYTDSEESGSENEETTDYDDDDDGYEDEDEDEEEEDDEDIDEYVESILGSDVEDDDDEFVSGSSSKTEESEDYNINVRKDHDHSSSVSKSSSVSEDHKVKQTLSSNSLEPSAGGLTSAAKTASAEGSNKPAEISTGFLTDQSEEHTSSSPSTSSSMKKSSNIASGPEHDSQRRNLLGRAAGSKNLSESTDSRLEDEDEIGRLEDIKAELQNQIAKEVKVNAKLQSELEKRKKAVRKRRLALEHDVAILQEQLQKEKNSRATLEAGLKLPPVPLPNLPGVDEKTKAELEELALVEAELTSLEQKVDDLRVWLNPQSEQKSKNKPDAEVTATSQLERSRSKENENERKPETTLPNKPGKRSGKKSEGKNSTSALTKLTTRLNFLKERRTQIANELQNMDKSQELGPPVQNSEKGEGSEQQQSATSPGKGSEQHKSPGKGSEQHKSPGKGSEQHKSPNKGAEFHISLPTPGKGAEFHISLPTPGKGPEFRISLPSPGGKSRRSEKAKGISDKGSGKEGRPLNNPDKLKKSDSHPPNRLDNKNQHPLERGKSEGSQHFKVDKGR